jgi:hypothetical protein
MLPVRWVLSLLLWAPPATADCTSTAAVLLLTAASSTSCLPLLASGSRQGATKEVPIRAVCSAAAAAAASARQAAVAPAISSRAAPTIIERPAAGKQFCGTVSGTR